MRFEFDLISDLHIETWDQPFDWTGRATSPCCVVAGDVGRDRHSVMQALEHLSRCYQAVFYIDGNDEHVDWFDDLGASYTDLARQCSRINNLVYLHGNVVVVDGVALLATNGWWGFDFDHTLDPDQAQQWYQEKWQGQVSSRCAQTMAQMALTDATYIKSSIKRLQSHNDVRHIVVITHTVPRPDLIQHDIELENTWRFNVMGNQYMQEALDTDSKRKIHTWCFGHYHRSVDQSRDGVRFVNNCRGRGQTEYRQYVFNPLRIIVED